MSVLAIPTALDVLRTQLASADQPDDLALPLRALQLRGLTKLELVVHLERLREANDATSRDEQFEENCLIALDIVHGALPQFGLEWDAAHATMSLLPRCVSQEDLAAAMPFVLEPSDLLPPRPRPTTEAGDVSVRLATAVYTSAVNYELRPSRCDLYRVPKGAFTTRPAALLSLPDRVVLETLAGYIEAPLAEALPAQVIWPRHRSRPPSPAEATSSILGWTSEYVVKADIANFYEEVDHALLGVFLSSHLQVTGPRARAVEALLTATMRGTRGLPQGPPSSDVLASAYLLPIDLRLAAAGTTYLRYADDYFFPAASMGQGRLRIQELEGLLGELGLSLNTAKTQIMRGETFERGLRRPSTAVVELKARLAQEEVNQLHEIQDADEVARVLEAAGVDEETLWGLLYHGTITLAEVVPDIIDDLAPSLTQTYGMYFHEIATMLSDPDRVADLAPLESLARECLAFLTASNASIDTEDLRRVQTWFPGLVPLVVRYMIAHEEDTDEWRTTYLTFELANPTSIDWVDAWTCHAALRTSAAEHASVQTELRRSLSASSTGPLTRVEALRALAAAGAVTEAEWSDVFNSASPALRSEMFIAALGVLHQYPWLAALLREATEPGLMPIALALKAGVEPTGD